MSQLSFEDLVNGVVPDASDFNSRLNALKNRINNGMESDNIADASVTTAKINNDAVTLGKLAHGTLGGLPYYAASGTPTELAGNTTTTQKFLAQTGTGSASAAPSWEAIAEPVFENALLHIRDEKAANTAGNSYATGAFRTVILNTVNTNEISGASLGSNQITLPTGTYWLEALAVTGEVADSFKIKVRNTTDASDILIGLSHRTNSANGDQSFAQVSGRFSIAAQKVIEIQIRQAATSVATASNFGVAEVYADVKIWKVA